MPFEKKIKATDLPSQVTKDLEILKDIVISDSKGKKLDVRFASDALEFDFQDAMGCGLDCLDVYLNGGLYFCRTYEVSGPESAGKSTFLDTLSASYQKNNGLVVRVESESTWDKQRAKLIGVIPERCLVIRPDSLEEGTRLISTTIQKVKEKLPNTPMLLLWDTITGAPTEAEQERFENPDSEKKEGQQAEARQIRQFLDSVTPMMTRMKVTLMLSTQVYGDRDQNAKWSPTEGYTIKGGFGPRHYASVRLFFLRGQGIEDKQEITTGYKTRIKIIKNKQSPWVQTVTAILSNEFGFDNFGTTYEQVKQYKLIGIASNGWGKYVVGNQERSIQSSKLVDHVSKYPDAPDYFKYLLLNFVCSKFVTMKNRMGPMLEEYRKRFGDVSLPNLDEKE